MSWTETLCAGSLATEQSRQYLDTVEEWQTYIILISGQQQTYSPIFVHLAHCSCTGRETRIGNCLKSTETQNCGHAQDVGLECNVPDSTTCLENTLHHVSEVYSMSYTVPA